MHLCKFSCFCEAGGARRDSFRESREYKGAGSGGGVEAGSDGCEAAWPALMLRVLVGVAAAEKEERGGGGEEEEGGGLGDGAGC